MVCINWYWGRWKSNVCTIRLDDHAEPTSGPRLNKTLGIDAGLGSVASIELVQIAQVWIVSFKPSRGGGRSRK
jgi:hypothetical protein